MFQCDQCHTEYGGIRGISAGRCGRCEPHQDVAAEVGRLEGAGYAGSDADRSRTEYLTSVSRLQMKGVGTRVSFR